MRTSGDSVPGKSIKTLADINLASTNIIHGSTNRVRG